MVHHERNYWQGQNQKISLPFKIVIDKTDILGEKDIANEFVNFFTDIDLKLARKIPE